GFGSDSLFDGFVALDAPISGTLKSRFTAGRRKQDGYVSRPDGTDLGDTNTYTLTSKFVWKPTKKLEARWLADYSNADEHGSPLVFASINTAANTSEIGRHTSELQSPCNLVCRLLLEKKKKKKQI